jgi:beta-glucosidase-like glycosyl hydrolase
LPVWGRAPETFSEDPYLTAQASTAEIRGIQSNHVIATVKHFVANNQEILRSSINVIADPAHPCRDLPAGVPLGRDAGRRGCGDVLL